MVEVATTDCFALVQDPPAKMKMSPDIDPREPIQPTNQNLVSNNLQANKNGILDSLEVLKNYFCSFPMV